MALHSETYKAIFVDKSKLLTVEDFNKVTKLADETKRPIVQLLLERSFISPNQFLQLLSDYFATPSTELKVPEIDLEALQLIPETIATKYRAIAFASKDNTVNVALENPTDPTVINELNNILPNRTIVPFVATELSLQRGLVLYGGSLQQKVQKVIAEVASDSHVDSNMATPAVTVFNSIVETAVLMDASDIHIEPFETEVVVRFRIDGMLRPIVSIPPKLHASLLARLKIVADLKVDQKRLPQDGRFNLDIKGQIVNFRVSTVPSLWGEKAVLRVLPKEAHLFDINNVGFLEGDLKLVRNHLKRPHGMILVTGPTGSGKTTTLYSFIQEIGNDRIDVINMSTIEDPIEYTIPRVTQIQIQPEIDLTFANGLRALLRQDPDIIMVGEIRDHETADFAVRSALVGRLLLSSLHTNDAPSTIPRLLDMGVEPYLISSTLSLVVGQRLTRKLCTYCRTSYMPTPDVVRELTTYHKLEEALARLSSLGIIAETSPHDLRLFKAVGCQRCDNTGYRGRTGVFEIMEITDKIRTAINNHEDSAIIRKIALDEGMKTMFEDGLSKILLGIIDLDELLRASYN